MTERLAVSVYEAARMISVSKTQMYRLIAAGEIHTARLGKRILVPIAELHRILDERVAV